MKVILFLKQFWLWLLLKIFGRNINLPTSWNELTYSQFIGIATVLENYRNQPEINKKNGDELVRLYLHLIKHLLRNNNFVKQWVSLHNIPPSYYPKHLEFLLKNNQRHYFKPIIKIGKKVFQGPEKRMQNISIAQFSMADLLFYNYRKTNDVNYLDALCATLYSETIKGRPQKFSKQSTEKNSVIFRKVAFKHKLAILYAYEGSRNYITNGYKYIFPEQKEEEKATPKKHANYTPFETLLHYKIGFDTSKLVQTERLNVHQFLKIYNNELAELEKQKQYGHTNA